MEKVLDGDAEGYHKRGSAYSFENKPMKFGELTLFSSCGIVPGMYSGSSCLMTASGIPKDAALPSQTTVVNNGTYPPPPPR
jgi:hypothetical protein